MTFGVTRDSALLYLAFAGTVMSYFVAAEETPNHWSFREWMQFGLMLTSYVWGLLRSSPLRHSEYGSAKITPEDTRRDVARRVRTQVAEQVKDQRVADAKDDEKGKE
jgi:hypothetical protein